MLCELNFLGVFFHAYKWHFSLVRPFFIIKLKSLSPFMKFDYSTVSPSRTNTFQFSFEVFVINKLIIIGNRKKTNISLHSFSCFLRLNVCDAKMCCLCIYLIFILQQKRSKFEYTIFLLNVRKNVIVRHKHSLLLLYDESSLMTKFYSTQNDLLFN